MKKSLIKAIIFISVISLVIPKPAMAYLDPGSTSYLYQILVAAVFGFLFYAKTVFNWIKSFFKGISSKKLSREENEAD